MRRTRSTIKQPWIDLVAAATSKIEPSICRCVCCSIFSVALVAAKFFNVGVTSQKYTKNACVAMKDKYVSYPIAEKLAPLISPLNVIYLLNH